MVVLPQSTVARPSPVLGVFFVVLLATPAVAQDYTGNVNPSAWSAPMVMHGAIKAQARRNAAHRSDRGVTRAQANACSQKARFRSEHGEDHPQVQRLYSLCRGIGR